MSSWLMSLIALFCILAGGAVGIWLQRTLPDHHLSADAKDFIRLGTGLVGTIAALVLGLLIASAKSTFDTKSGQVNTLIADAIVLDNLLAQFGPDAVAARQELRKLSGEMVDQIWNDDVFNFAEAKPFEMTSSYDTFSRMLLALSPNSDSEQRLKAQLIKTAADIAKTRFLLFAESESSIPMPFVAILVIWLMIIFASFSLFAPPNAVVLGCLFLFSLSAAGAIFLVLELGQPFDGLMQIPGQPLRNALAPLPG